MIRSKRDNGWFRVLLQPAAVRTPNRGARGLGATGAPLCGSGAVAAPMGNLAAVACRGEKSIRSLGSLGDLLRVGSNSKSPPRYFIPLFAAVRSATNCKPLKDACMIAAAAVDPVQ